MLFLLFLKPKLNFTEKTHAFRAFPDFSKIPMVKAEYLKGIVAPTSEKPGKARKALVFSCFSISALKNEKSTGFPNVFAYHNLDFLKKHWFSQCDEFVVRRMMRSRRSRRRQTFFLSVFQLQLKNTGKA